MSDPRQKLPECTLEYAQRPADNESRMCAPRADATMRLMKEEKNHER